MAKVCHNSAAGCGVKFLRRRTKRACSLQPIPDLMLLARTEDPPVVYPWFQNPRNRRGGSSWRRKGRSCSRSCSSWTSRLSRSCSRSCRRRSCSRSCSRSCRRSCSRSGRSCSRNCSRSGCGGQDFMRDHPFCALPDFTHQRLWNRIRSERCSGHCLRNPRRPCRSPRHHRHPHRNPEPRHPRQPSSRCSRSLRQVLVMRHGIQVLVDNAVYQGSILRLN